MRPVLFNLFGFPVPSYGVFLALGFTVAFIIVYFEARRLGLDTEDVLDVLIWVLVGAIIGSRLMYVVVEWDYFRERPAEAFYMWRGGLALYGGGFGIIAAVLISASLKKLPLGKTADVVALAAVPGAMIGRVGCLLNGCCYGRRCLAPWAVTYTAKGGAAWLIEGIPVHPTPLYSIAMLAAILLILLVLSRKKRFDGQVFWALCALYSLGRFIVELYRGDPRGYVVEPYIAKWLAFLLQNQTYSDPGHGGFYRLPLLSSSQFVAIFVFIAAAAGYIAASRRAHRSESPTGE